jgi:hypothetical protein
MEKKRTEWRDGRLFTVTELPAAKPPKGRSKKTRYHFEDVGKPGTKFRRRARTAQAKEPEPEWVARHQALHSIEATINGQRVTIDLTKPRK